MAIAGCGGGGSVSPTASTTSSSAKRGTATFTITWPKPTRLIPGETNSIKIVLTALSVTYPTGVTSQDLSTPLQITSSTTQNYVTRPTNATTSNIQTIPLYPGTYAIQATAYNGAVPATDITNGVAPLAQGGGTTSVALTIVAGTPTTAATITMATQVANAKLTINGITALSGGSLAVTAASPWSFSVVPTNVGGKGLVLYPTSLPVGTITTTGASAIAISNSDATPSAGSTIAGTLVANSNANAGANTTFSLTYGETTPPTVFNFTVQFNSVAVSNPAFSVVTPNTNVHAILDCATVQTGKYLYLVADNTVLHNHFVEADVTLDPDTNPAAVAVDINSTLLAPVSLTEFYVGDPSGTISEFGAAPAVANLTALTDLKFAGTQLYALSGGFVWQMGATNTKLFTGAKIATATALGLSEDFTNNVVDFPNLVGSELYLDTTTGGVIETPLIGSVTAISASPVGAQIFAVNGATLEGVSPTGTIVFSTNISGIDSGSVTRMSVSSPDTTNAYKVSGTLIAASVGLPVVVQF
jgi:hypothetical protein